MIDYWKPAFLAASNSKQSVARQIINHPSSIINPYRLIAPAGQVSTQTPQSTQLSGLTFALPLSMVIALLGHSCVQDSQPVHFPLST